MKRLHLIFVFILVTSNLIGQNSVSKLFSSWDKAYQKAQFIYDTINNQKERKDAFLKEAHDSLSKCDVYFKQLQSMNHEYMTEVKLNFYRSLNLFSIFTRITSANPVFKKDEALSLAKTFESITPQVKRYLVSDTKQKWTQLSLDSWQCNAYWEVFRIYQSVEDTVGISKSIDRYMDLLHKKLTNPLTFCSDLCRDTTMTLEKNRLNYIIDNIDSKRWGGRELDLRILEIELRAENQDSIDIIEKIMTYNDLLIIDLMIGIDKPENVLKYYDELTRLKQTVEKLGLKKEYLRYYTVLVSSFRAKDNDRLEYLKEVEHYLSTKSDNELLDNIHADMVDVCNLLFDSWAYSSESFEQLKAYYDMAGNTEGVNKCCEKLAELEKERLKREKKERFDRNWGLTVGIEPFKTLFNGGKQGCYYADITALGHYQGIRYCNFEGLTDKGRFSSLFKKNEDPGGSYGYSGHEASYWIDLFSLGHGFLWEQFVLEYRYGNYKFDPLSNATLLNRSTNTADLTGVTVNPIGVTNDVTLNCRFKMYVIKRVLLEAYVGVGLGYRKLKANQDLKKYLIDDAAYGDDRWNKWTYPGRIGFRIGINLF